MSIRNLAQPFREGSAYLKAANAALRVMPPLVRGRAAPLVIKEFKKIIFGR